MQKRFRRNAALVVGVFFVMVVGIALFAQRNVIYDWSRLHNYKPPAAIVQLATDTTMTSDGRTLLYINHPQLDNKATFSKVCPTGGEKTIVLGCYHPVQRGIYLYRVTDPQLNGVEQVTAAHEMLHAAYDRLSPRERSYVDGLLENYYRHDLRNPTVAAEIAAYKQSEPHAVVNEMHSVFGTEIANLPAPLEQYYKQYFTDRQKITQYASDYRSAFTYRETSIKQYDAQLSKLYPKITEDKAKLDTQLAAITAAKAQLDAEQSSDNTNAYNADVPTYNAAVDSYDSLIISTRQIVLRYNDIVDKRNAIAFEEQQLSQALNSSPISN